MSVFWDAGARVKWMEQKGEIGTPLQLRVRYGTVIMGTEEATVPAGKVIVHPDDEADDGVVVLIAELVSELTPNLDPRRPVLAQPEAKVDFKDKQPCVCNETDWGAILGGAALTVIALTIVVLGFAVSDAGREVIKTLMGR